MRAIVAVAALGALASACASDDGEGGGVETIERPARPPPGWRTVTNSVAGFTIAAPRKWPAATSRGATLIRSEDRLVAITIQADRGAAGRELSATRYARRTIRSLPGFKGRVTKRVRRIRASPYPTAVVEGSGSVNTTIRRQRISVAAFRQVGTATYTAIVFRNATVERRLNDGTIARMLATFRAGASRR